MHHDAREPAAGGDLGALPEWDLGDLYAAPDAPEIARDLDWLRGRVPRPSPPTTRASSPALDAAGPARGDPPLRADPDRLRAGS